MKRELEEAVWIRDDFPYGCPGCGAEISDFIEDGSECDECGYVFTPQR